MTETVYVWYSNIGRQAVLITPHADPRLAYFDVFGNVCPGDITADVKVNGHCDGRFEDRCHSAEYTGKPLVPGRLSDVWAEALAKFFG